MHRNSPLRRHLPTTFNLDWEHWCKGVMQSNVSIWSTRQNKYLDNLPKFSGFMGLFQVTDIAPLGFLWVHCLCSLKFHLYVPEKFKINKLKTYKKIKNMAFGLALEFPPQSLACMHSGCPCSDSVWWHGFILLCFELLGEKKRITFRSGESQNQVVVAARMALSWPRSPWVCGSC